MARRTLPLAALTAAAALTLTACGGSGEPDDIKGAGGSASAGASDKGEEKDGRPSLKLPEDVQLAFESTPPSDSGHAAALADAENYIRALAHGIVEQDPEDKAHQFYSEGAARQYAKEQIQQWVDGEWTATGKDRYYRAETADVGKSKGVLVTMCRNQAEYFGKNIKTGKVERTEESIKSYQKFSLLMRPAQGADEHWVVQQIEVQGEVQECKG
ncbi:hypothetical protein ABZ338_28230 [Streptomyces albidoflavus]|uniref:hypothetical protein n=1 Tax=Streptomyces albidoflavus TaxID=1886 RepID=UPI0033E31DD0